MIYIGPAFNVNNLYVIFKIALATSKAKSFEKILIDSESDFVSELYSKELSIITKNSLNSTFDFIDILKSTLLFFKILFYASLRNLKSEERYQTILLHSAWDLTRLKTSNQNYFILWTYFLLNLLRCIKYGIQYEKFILENKITTAFVSHDVYQYKIFNFLLDKAGLKVYLVTNFTIGTYGDTGRTWFLRLFKNYSDIKEEINHHLVRYWEDRQRGKAIYADASRNYAVSDSVEFSFKGANFIFLHVFRDSPYLDIDTSRIFRDYYDWFETTLKIINETKESWIIKPHPSSRRWGSDDNDLISKLIKKHCRRLLSENRVSVIVEEISNSRIIEQANKIITFSGTIFLESIANGKRPIIISYLDDDSTCLNLTGAYLKPKSILEYREMLISVQDPSVNDSVMIRKAQELLYIREDLFNLSEPLGLQYIYRADPLDTKSSIFNSSVTNVDKQENVIKMVVERLIMGKPISRYFMFIFLSMGHQAIC